MALEIKDVCYLAKRINRVEIFLWVALVLSVIFGVGGTSLWNSLQSVLKDAKYWKTS